MLTLIEQKHIKFDPDGRDAILGTLSVTTSDELPTPTGVDGYRLHEGFKAWDITNGEWYGLTANGTWNKQEGGFKMDLIGGM